MGCEQQKHLSLREGRIPKSLIPPVREYALKHARDPSMIYRKPLLNGYGVAGKGGSSSQVSERALITRDKLCSIFSFDAYPSELTVGVNRSRDS